MPASEPTLRLRGGGADTKRKEARKRKFATQPAPATRSTQNPSEQAGSKGAETADPSPPAAQPSKKRKRTQKNEDEPSATNGGDDSKGATPIAAADNEAETPPGDGNATPTAADAETAEAKSQRFIVFIGSPLPLPPASPSGATFPSYTAGTQGNLPFTATTESIRTHFAKVQPESIRHSTHKETGKSKGFAFLEFSGYDRMKTCLKLYHHSSFEDGVSPARKINVELT